MGILGQVSVEDEDEVDAKEDWGRSERQGRGPAGTHAQIMLIQITSLSLVDSCASINSSWVTRKSSATTPNATKPVKTAGTPLLTSPSAAPTSAPNSMTKGAV